MNRRRARMHVCLGASAALLAGCLNNVVTLADERADAATGESPGGGAGSVDLLVVIDNSGSMRAGQDYFNNYASALTSALVEQHGARDVRVGVISTDLGTGGAAALPGCATPDGDDAVLNPRARGQATRGRSLAELPAAMFCGGFVNSPFITLRERDDAMLRYWAPSCHATLGTAGCGVEQPLEAALRALTSRAGASGPNAGFLRRDAVLAVLVVSDEDDGSVRDCRQHDGVGPCVDARSVWEPGSSAWASPDLNLRFYLYTPQSAQDPTWPLDRYVDPQRLNRGLLGLKPGHPERVVFGAVTGVPLALPARPDGGTDWRVLLGASPDGRDGYAGDSAEGRVSMRAADRDPACPNRVVPACRARGSSASRAGCDLASQYYAWPARRLAEVARRLDESGLCGGGPCRNGMVASICDAGDSSPLSRFAGMVARRLVR